MWLGTYQPNYTVDDMRDRPDLDKQGDYAGFPFYPVWCVPCEDPTDMFVASVLTMPRYPELFYMFQTNEYVRLDKAKLYAYLAEHSMGEITDITDFIADASVPDIYCEFIVDKDVFDSVIGSGQNCILAYPLVLPLFLDGQDYVPITWFVNQTYTSFGMDHMEHARDVMKKMLASMPDIEYRDSQMQIWTKGGFKTDIPIAKLKMLFECTFLPVLWYYVQRDFHGSGLMMDFALDNPCVFSIFKIYEKYYWWTEEAGFDMDAYRKFVEDMRACMPSGEAFLDHYWHKGKPGRNDSCPCGSGKKFKKCCGRFM